MNAEPFPADPGFPQLRIATEPELMRGVFQEHLQPLDKKPRQIRECRIFGIRRQQALRRCMLQYVLRLEEPGMERERNQWVTGVMYTSDQARRMRWKLQLQSIWEKLRRSRPGRTIANATPIFAPFSYIPGLEMLVQVFPYDHQLPALPLLIAGPPPELEPLLLARFGPGDWQVETWDVEPVRYRAELRATLLLTVRARDAATGRTQDRRFYAKVYDDETIGEQTHRVLLALWDRARAGSAGFAVGEPIAYLGELRTLFQEEVSGISLEDMLLREDELTPAVRKVARALAALHLDPGAMPSRRRPPQREAAIVERAGKLLRWVCPHLAREIEEVVDAAVAGLEEVPPAPSHCGLKLEHVMLDGDRLTLLDLDEFAGADPMLDVSHILVPLANAPLSFPLPQNRARTVARAFVEEYFAHAPEAWRARLPLYYTLAVLKMAAGFFRRQTPGFPGKIEALIGEARDSLAGKVVW